MSIPPSTRRKRRFSAGQARSALLAAGLELLEERGLESGLARVTLSEAVVRSGVPRPSAYRVFSNGDFDPQEEFRTSVLVHLLSEVSPAAAASAGFKAGREVLSEEADRLASGDPDQLAFVLREVLRVCTETIWRMATPTVAAYFATVVSLAVDPDPYPPLVEAHRALRVNAAKRNSEFYTQMMSLFGLRLRPGMDLDQFAAAFALQVSQVWDGNLTMGPEPSLKLPTGFDGEVRLWTPLGLSSVGFVLVSAEADPDAAVSARLTSWLET